MCVGRLVVGFGVGSAAMIIPLYIAEIAPTSPSLPKPHKTPANIPQRSAAA